MSSMKPRSDSTVRNFASPAHVILAHLWSGEMHWKQALFLVEPVCHLTVDNISNLVDFPYVVGPKADGERALLIGDWSTSNVFLLNMSGSVLHMQGAHTGSLCGFILDVEVANGPDGSQLVLSFDVLALHPKIDLSGHGRSGKWDEIKFPSLVGSTPLNIITAYQERREILSAIVDSTTMAGLLMKPIADAADASTIWAKAQKLPYPVDGLIFTPCCHDSTQQIPYKWKPPQQLTIDVALGNKLRQEDEKSLFRSHLSMSTPEHFKHHWPFMDSSNSALDGHAPFRFNAFDAKRSSHPFSEVNTALASDTEYAGYDDDIAFADEQDRLASVGTKCRTFP